MTHEESRQGPPDELVDYIKRLVRIILEKLEQGSNEGTLDQAQTRLYSSIVMRSLSLWLEALNPRPRRQLRSVLDGIEAQLREDTLGKGEE
jgi:hypothetical protein